MAVQLQQRHRVEEEELAAESEVEIDDDLVGGMTSGANAAAATLTSEQQPLEGVERQATSADDAEEEEEEEEEISATIDEATSTVQLPRVRQLGSVRQTLLKQAELSRISPAVLSVLSSKLRISTVDELLHASRADIQRATKLSLMQVNDILSEASSYVFPSKPRTALQLLRDPLERQRCLPLGCAVLDEFLAGGVRVGALTEITGAAGTGKSQLCMQLALSAQLPEQLGGLDGGASLASAKARSLTRDFALTERAGAGAGGATEVVYISTEKPFPSSRWKQLLRAFLAKHAQHFGSEAELDRRVHRHSASTIEVLWEFLTNHLPLLLNSRKVRLLLIDSIAAVCRFEFERSDAAARAKALWLHAHYLRSVADNYKLPVVVVNQVSDYFGTAAESDLHHHLLATTTSTSSSSSGDGSSTVIPALGLAWSSCINARILLTNTTTTIDPPEGVSAPSPPQPHSPALIEQDDEPSPKRQRVGTSTSPYSPEAALQTSPPRRIPSSPSSSSSSSSSPTKKKSSSATTYRLSKPTVRTMHVVLAPNLPNSSKRFYIAHDGLHGLSE